MRHLLSDFSAFPVAEGKGGKTLLEDVEPWVAGTKLVGRITGELSCPCIASCLGADRAIPVSRVWIGLVKLMGFSSS